MLFPFQKQVLSNMPATHTMVTAALDVTIFYVISLSETTLVLSNMLATYVKVTAALDATILYAISLSETGAI